MKTVQLRDREWEKIHAYLKQAGKIYVGAESECRTFVEGVLWVMRSGAAWRLLPEEYGKWNSVYKRFARWTEQGIWEGLLTYVAEEPDMEHGMVDSTVVRAHPCAAGAPQKV